MADAVYVAKNTVFSAATGAKTALNVIAGANNFISVIEFGISFDGVTSSAVPATVDIFTSTQAGAGTPGSSPTPIQTTGRTKTIQATSGINYTAEPTTLTAIESFFVPQFMGLFVKQYPLGQEPETDTSGGTVKGIGIRVNTTATVNVFCYIRFIEV